MDEYHQSFVPSRTASIFDSLIDIAGGLTAFIVVREKPPLAGSLIKLMAQRIISPGLDPVNKDEDANGNT